MDNVNFYNSFLRRCREKGISPSAAAEAAGLNRSQVTRWKKGQGFTDTSAIKIADYFGVSVDELLDEKKPAAQGDGLNEKLKLLNDLFDRCSPEDQNLAIDFLKRLSQGQSNPGSSV